MPASRNSFLVRSLMAVAVLAVVSFPAADALARAGGGSSTSSGHSSSSHSSGSSSRLGGYSSHSGGYYGGYHHHHHHDHFYEDDDFAPHDRGPGFPWWFDLLVIAGFLGTFFMIAMSMLRHQDSLMTPQNRNEKFLRKIARHDSYWSPDHLRERVAEVFYKVQEAWTERDQEIARDYMSPRLYHKHKRQTDHMLAIGKRNVLEDLQLNDVEVVYIADRKGTKDDEFWALVSGQMIDNETVVDWDLYGRAAGALTPKMIDDLKFRVAVDMPQSDLPKQFQELWKFTREGDEWVLDKIDHDLAYARSGPKPFSEEVA